MENHSTRNVGRTDLLSELGAALAARETDPTPVVTYSSGINRAEPTSAIVTRSRAREGRGGNVVPEVGFWPETETRQEVNKPQEIQVSMSAICEGGFGTTRQETSDTASQYIASDRPETTAALAAIFTESEVVRESNPKLSETPKPPFHINTGQMLGFSITLRVFERPRFRGHW